MISTCDISTADFSDSMTDLPVCWGNSFYTLGNSFCELGNSFSELLVSWGKSICFTDISVGIPERSV